MTDDGYDERTLDACQRALAGYKAKCPDDPWAFVVHPEDIPEGSSTIFGVPAQTDLLQPRGSCRLLVLWTGSAQTTQSWRAA